MKNIFVTAIVLISLIFSNNSFSQTNVLLISPRDSDTIETKNPLLTWTYLTAVVGQNSREEYRLILVELKKDQSAEVGVTMNTPILKMNQLQGNQMFYPYDAPKLVEGHSYGWQIFKLSNNVLVDKSEAFVFTIAKKKEPEYKKYALLKKKCDGLPYTISGDKLYFKMSSSASHQKLNLEIKNNKGEIQKNTVKLDKTFVSDEFVALSGGTNSYEVDISNLPLGSYQLTVKDHKNQTFLMNFNLIK